MDVYFEGGYWGHDRKAVLCRSLGVHREFCLNGCNWKVLDLYVCNKGIIMELAKAVSKQLMEDFIKKWINIDEKNLSPREKSLIEYENPLGTYMPLEVWVNKKKIESMSGCSSSYIPCDITEKYAEDNKAAFTDISAKELVRHYGLDQNEVWQFYRYSVKRSFRKAPSDINLKIKFLPQKLNVPCDLMFETVTGQAGKSIKFEHPVTGKKYTLNVCSVLNENITQQIAEIEKQFTLPKNVQVLEYSIEGCKDNEKFILTDTQNGDAPVLNTTHGKDRKKAGVSVIGGADGPVSIFLAGRIHDDDEGKGNTKAKEQESSKEDNSAKEVTASKNILSKSRHTAYSRLMFKPVERTKWQLYAVVQNGEEQEVDIIYSQKMSKDYC